jgi:hypothetical protein
MKRVVLGAAGWVAGAFAAGFLCRSIYALRDALSALDRQDAELTRRWNREELMDELRRDGRLH